MTSVVIADDEVGLVEVLSELFEINKINVVGIGSDGKQAVQLCEQHNPDFLILDLTMPEFDGFYALEKLSDTVTKIIILTGTSNSNILKKLESYSILTIQTKPLDFDTLLTFLNS